MIWMICVMGVLEGGDGGCGGGVWVGGGVGEVSFIVVGAFRVSVIFGRLCFRMGWNRACVIIIIIMIHLPSSLVESRARQYLSRR